MTRREFFIILDRKIRMLPYEEKIEILKYYEEYFDELGLNKEDEIPDDFDPHKIGKEILLENGIKNLNNKTKNKNSIINNIIGFGFSIPIVALTIFGVSIGLLVLLLFSYLVYAFIKYFILLNINIYHSIYNVSFYSVLKYIVLFIILIFIVYPIMKFVLKIIFSILISLFSKIFYGKKSRKYKRVEKEEKIDYLNKINLDVFVGEIIIKKGNENSIKYKGKYSNYEYENGILNIYLDKKINNINIKDSEFVEITYNNNNLFLNIEKMVGKAKMETYNSNKINIKSLVGKFEFLIEKDICVNNKNILGVIKLEKGLSNSYSDLVLDVENVVGKIEIKKKN